PHRAPRAGRGHRCARWRPGVTGPGRRLTRQAAGAVGRRAEVGSSFFEASLVRSVRLELRAEKRLGDVTIGIDVAARIPAEAFGALSTAQFGGRQEPATFVT